MEKYYIVYDFQESQINWEQVPKLKLEEFPWYREGEKQLTTVQCAIREEGLHIKTYSMDRNIRAEVKTNNEAVYEDSCFEWFVTPIGKKGDDYFNIEVSCNGTIYIAYRDNTEGRILASKELIDQIKIQSAIYEDHWTLELCIPFTVLESMQKAPIDRQIWYANFYRCGGKKDQQYACWNAIVAEEPDFHQPSQFGKLIICKV